MKKINRIKKTTIMMGMIGMFMVTGMTAKADAITPKGKKLEKKVLEVAKENDSNLMLETNVFGVDEKMGSNKANLDRKFEIGSVTKILTSTAIFQLQEQGKLNIDDNISKYLTKKMSKSLVINGIDYSKAKVKDYLCHRSGLGDSMNTSNKELVEKFNNSKHIYTLEEQIQMAKDNKGMKFHEIGEVTQYSNVGYMILGQVIENISGKSYEEYVEENILQPLNMKNTRFYDGGKDIIVGKYKETVAITPPTLSGAAGAYVSTLDDVKLLLQGVFKHKIISKETLDRMVASSNAVDFGLTFDKISDDYLGHNGGTLGFTTFAYYNAKNDKYLVVSLANSENTDDIVEVLKDIVLER